MNRDELKDFARIILITVGLCLIIGASLYGIVIAFEGMGL